MKLRCVFLSGAVLFLACSSGKRLTADDNGGSTEITNARITGTIYAMDDSATVKPASAWIGIYPKNKSWFAADFRFDSCETDSMGWFSVEVHDTGYFNLVALGTSRYSGLVPDLHLGASDTIRILDTMQISCAMTGTVMQNPPADTGRIVAYIAGSPFIAPADSAGGFIFPLVPNQPLNIQFALQLPADTAGVHTYKTYDTLVSVTPVSGETIRLDTIMLGVPKDTLPVNHAPVFASTPATMTQSAVVGRQYRDSLVATDADADTLTYSFIASITGMQLTDTILTYTPVRQDTGLHVIRVRVSDNHGGMDTLSWTMTVRDSTVTPPDVHTGMKLIPGGTFTMGSMAGATDEQPLHSVTVDSFWMDSTEVTNGQFKSVMGYLYVDPSNPVLPVRGVTWNEAIIYCNELSVKAQLDPAYIYPQKVKDSYGRWTIAGNLTIDYTKKGFRLPTEAEWEFACRAGSDQPFYWNARSGNQFLDDTASLYAWYLYNTGLPCQVGTKKPNAWGLYDMVGNALEWCNDWYDATYYRTSPVSNPAGPQTGAMRVLRGGCYVNSITEMQMPVRFNGYPNNKNTDGSDETFWLTRGFRTVLPQ